jgi:N utilization substance protein B
MKERRLAREVAMQILFQWEAQGQLLRFHAEQPAAFKNLDIESFVSQFWMLFYNSDQQQRLDRTFTSDLVRGTLNSLALIDILIDKISTKWKLARMDAIDRAILRLATFELTQRQHVAPAIVINEAVELAKRYGNEQSPQFINGILDAIKSRDK